MFEEIDDATIQQLHADNAIANRQAAAHDLHKLEVSLGNPCSNPDCYHNQPAGKDIPF